MVATSRRASTLGVSGRIAQRESARLTRGRSMVRSHLRPPSAAWLSGTRMVERVRCAGNAGKARAVPTPVPTSRMPQPQRSALGPWLRGKSIRATSRESAGQSWRCSERCRPCRALSGRRRHTGGGDSRVPEHEPEPFGPFPHESASLLGTSGGQSPPRTRLATPSVSCGPSCAKVQPAALSLYWLVIQNTITPLSRRRVSSP
jgi:hypothetical protein